MKQKLSEVEQKVLLQIARDTIEKSVQGQSLPDLSKSNLSPNLQLDGASFVTLTINGNLRGCIGTLEAYQPLAIDVQEHAVAAALHDPRFPRVLPKELGKIEIEVSVLTPKQILKYDRPLDLVQKIRPGIDGVVLQDGFLKATFLPQVWDQLEQPEIFLSHLCAKMGASSDLWRKKILQVFTYQVQEFHE